MRSKTLFLSLVGLILFSWALSACASPALAQAVTPTDTPPLRTLSVTGNAQVSLTPDLVYISVGVHTENADPAKAVDENTTKAQKVIDALKAKGVAAEDIRTSNFSIYPQDIFDQNGEKQGTTFVVDNTVTVKVKDLVKIGDILGAAVTAGANNIYGISFDVEDKQEAMDNARQDAIKNAQAQAQIMAEAAGVELGAVQSINSYGGTPGPIYDYKYGMGGGAQAEAAPVPISPGQLTYTVEVSLVYEIK